MVYLDNSATTRPCRAAIDAASQAMELVWGNPSSQHKLGIAAARLLREARGHVAEALGADAERVFFTSGGTEADNWAIFSTAARMGKRGRHIVTTQIEHHAVLNCMKRLEQQGFEVSYLQPDADGRITAEQLKAALRPDTILVSVMMVNNEVGSVLPIAQMAKLTHRICPDALFHTDAVQGFLKLPFRAKALEADLISISGHKIHAPKGVGALYIRKGLTLPPYLFGGGQESGARSGTEALPAIAAFGAACHAAYPTLREDLRRETALRELLCGEVRKLAGVHLHGAQEAPHIVSLSVSGVRSQGLINCLQDREIYVSAGSACAKGHRSHVLEAMHVPPEQIDGAIRVSLSRETTEADILEFVDALRAAIEQLT